MKLDLAIESIYGIKHNAEHVGMEEVVVCLTKKKNTEVRSHDWFEVEIEKLGLRMLS